MRGLFFTLTILLAVIVLYGCGETDNTTLSDSEVQLAPLFFDEPQEGAEGRLRARLTDEQQQQIHETVAEMKEAEATHNEIKAAVRELIEGFGIELPDNRGKHQKRGQHGKHQKEDGLFAELTDEQRQQIHETGAEMKEAGATHDEIKAAVKELLKGFGVEVPDDWGERQKQGGLFAELTDEQRQQIHETVAEMKEAGATQDEIKAAVKELLKGFGVEAPDDRGEHQKGRQSKRQGHNKRQG